MTSAVDIFTIVRALLLDSVDLTLFDPANIMQDFQAVTTKNFISYAVLPLTERTSLTAVNSYNATDETKTSLLLYNNVIQVDFFSDAAYIAQNAALTFNQYLVSFASDFLSDNYFGSSIGIIKEIQNLTEVGDKATYLNRYMMRFELYSHYTLTKAQRFMDVEITQDFIA